MLLTVVSRCAYQRPQMVPFNWTKDIPIFSQVQLQMAVTKLMFADFIVWTPSDIHIERIQPDATFLTVHLEKPKELYVLAILPELLAKWYTTPRNSQQSLSDTFLYCYCRVKAEESLVLNCSNEACLFRKFHMKCCGLSRKPANKAWLCPDCRKLKKVSVLLPRQP